jgi:hypothetical protein
MDLVIYVNEHMLYIIAVVGKIKRFYADNRSLKSNSEIIKFKYM